MKNGEKISKSTDRQLQQGLKAIVGKDSASEIDRNVSKVRGLVSPRGK